MSQEIPHRLVTLTVAVGLVVVADLAPGAASPAGSGPAAGDYVVPLAGVAPNGGGPVADLETLAGWLEGAEIVGLGEALHGTDDFHRLMHRIFAHLSAAEGFETIALEISQAHAERLDAYVRGERDDLEALLAERWWTAKAFYDRALTDLLLWMREQNRRRARPLKFAGYDFKQPSFAIAAVLEGLERLDGAAAEAPALVETIAALGGLGVFPNVYGFTAGARIALPPGRSDDGPRRLVVKLRLRGSGVSHGYAGFAVDETAGSFGRLRQTRSLRAEDLGGEWRSEVLTAEWPADLTEVWLELYHRGNGSVWFDGLDVELDHHDVTPSDGLAALEPRALSMPRLQVMDYTRALETQAPGEPGPLRVDCSPAVDRALEAVDRIEALVDASLKGGGERWSAVDRDRLRHAVRLLRQSVEWRTLVEPNRDRFLAENVAWLAEQAPPGSRLLVFGHTSHTERVPNRMGTFLAERFGDRYRTVSMLALEGWIRYFGDPRDSAADAPLEHRRIRAEDLGPMEGYLASLGPGDLIFHRAAAEDQLTLPEAHRAEVLILLRRVAGITEAVR